jgi:hypothetical protein
MGLLPSEHKRKILFILFALLSLVAFMQRFVVKICHVAWLREPQPSALLRLLTLFTTRCLTFFLTVLKERMARKDKNLKTENFISQTTKRFYAT